MYHAVSYLRERKAYHDAFIMAPDMVLQMKLMRKKKTTHKRSRGTDSVEDIDQRPRGWHG